MTQIERKLTTYSNMPRYDDCYPRYQFNFTGVTDQPSIAEAAEMYYDDYYRQVDAFIEKFPGRIKYRSLKRKFKSIWQVNARFLLSEQQFIF